MKSSIHRQCLLYVGLLLTLSTCSIVLLVLRTSASNHPVSLLTSYKHYVLTGVTSDISFITNTSNRMKNASHNLEQVTMENVHTGTSSKIFADRFPRVMIVGFGKAGTKALYEFLKQHPQLSGPPKEMRFFSQHYNDDLNSYLESMPASPPGGYVIEKSPDYILVPQAAERIIASAESLGVPASKLRFVVILRNPIDRSMSDYLEWNVQREIRGQQHLPMFEKMLEKKTNVKFINTSCYAYHIKHWLKHFSATQLCYVDGDLFTLNPYHEIHKLESCLKLSLYFKKESFVLDRSKRFYCYRDAKQQRPMCMGKSKGRLHPLIVNGTYQRLVEYFSRWDQELFDITKLNWSWFNNY